MISSLNKQCTISVLRYNIAHRSSFKKYNNTPSWNDYSTLYSVYYYKYRASPYNTYIGISEVYL